MYKYLMAVLVLLAGFSAYSANKNITYLVAYESEEFASTQMYSVEVTSGFTETVALDGGYTLEVVGSLSGVSTVLKVHRVKPSWLRIKVPTLLLMGTFFLFVAKAVLLSA